jgi:hypothetical protein
MMYPRFFEMVAYASGKGIKVSTNSNVTLMSHLRAKKCVTSGLDSLHVSVDGAHAASYESIRIGATFERLSKNIMLVRDARSRLESSRPPNFLVRGRLAQVSGTTGHGCVRPTDVPTLTWVLELKGRAVRAWLWTSPRTFDWHSVGEACLAR